MVVYNLLCLPNIHIYIVHIGYIINIQVCLLSHSVSPRYVEAGDSCWGVIILTRHGRVHGELVDLSQSATPLPCLLPHLLCLLLGICDVLCQHRACRRRVSCTLTSAMTKCLVKGSILRGTCSGRAVVFAIVIEECYHLV